MKVSSFFHGSHGSDTTLSEIKRVNNWAQSEEFLGAYAYATQSGAAAFDLELGAEFWGITPSKWIFGIDYGRTQPGALRFIAEQNSAAVRIHDGEWLLHQPGFIPRRDFHAKAAFLNNDSINRYGVVAGSGNFSASGLQKCRGWRSTSSLISFGARKNNASLLSLCAGIMERGDAS